MAALLAMDGWTLLALDLGAEDQRTETKNKWRLWPEGKCYGWLLELSAVEGGEGVKL